MELYRKHEIFCVVDQSKRDKSSAWRHCFLIVQHIDGQLARYYRVDVISWSTQAGKTLGMQYAIERQDATLALLPLRSPARARGEFERCAYHRRRE